MLEGWDKVHQRKAMTRSVDWIYRIGPEVVIEVNDLNGPGGNETGAPTGVVYAELIFGQGLWASRVALGPVRYGSDRPDDRPLIVPTLEDALRAEEVRGRERARFILEKLIEAEVQVGKSA